MAIEDYEPERTQEYIQALDWNPLIRAEELVQSLSEGLFQSTFVNGSADSGGRENMLDPLLCRTNLRDV